jgi:hypothetical protein
MQSKVLFTHFRLFLLLVISKNNCNFTPKLLTNNNNLKLSDNEKINENCDGVWYCISHILRMWFKD